MDLGVLEGQTKRAFFLDSIFDPSVNQCSGSPVQTSAKIPRNLLWPVYTNLEERQMEMEAKLESKYELEIHLQTGN